MRKNLHICNFCSISARPYSSRTRNPSKERSRPAGYMQVNHLFLHSAPPVALIIAHLFPRRIGICPRSASDLVYALSEACFVEWVRQNSSSRGRVTPKGIYAIRMVFMGHIRYPQGLKARYNRGVKHRPAKKSCSKTCIYAKFVVLLHDILAVSYDTTRIISHQTAFQHHRKQPVAQP